MSHSEASDSSGGPTQQDWFATTHWSVVLAARVQGSPQAAEALEKLCRAYWYPLYAYVRRRGYTSEDAQDLTQEFFARLLRKNYPAQADRAKGKFRSFLLLTLSHFLADEHDRTAAQRRGGGQIVISLDEQSPENRYCLEPADERSPERIFERRWAQTVLDRAIARLQAEFVDDDRAEIYEVLKAFQPGEQNTPSYAEAATCLGVSESAVRSMIHRLRRRHRELVREEIAQTVSTSAEVDEELRHLIAVIAG
jgi:RNA polymerase sigma factor (sigma-70 family)